MSGRRTWLDGSPIDASGDCADEVPDPVREMAHRLALRAIEYSHEYKYLDGLDEVFVAPLRAFLAQRDGRARTNDLFHRIEVQSGASAPDEGEIEPWTEHLDKLSGPVEAPCLVRVRFTAEDGEPEDEVVGVGVVFPWIESDPEMGLAVCAHLVGEKGHSEVVWASEWDLVANPQVASVRTESIEALRDLRAYQEGDQVRDDLETAVSLLQRRRINGTITAKEARFLDRLRADRGGS